MPNTPLVPYSFLFQYQFPVERDDAISSADAKSASKQTIGELADPGSLDDATRWLAMKLAWNEAGLLIQAECEPGLRQLRLWLDTRDTKNIHRASRYCHLFQLDLEAVGKSKNVVAEQVRIQNAQDSPPEVKPDQLQTSHHATKTAETLQLWLAAEVLNGYLPLEQPKLGFFYDAQHEQQGKQAMIANDAFPYHYDPSLWATIELV